MSIITTGYVCDGDILSRFLNDRRSFVKGIRGPIGSGTSSGCCMDLFSQAVNQKPGPDGLRHTRTLIVRQTNPQLETTTIKTWLDWFPEQEFGKFRWSPPYTHRIRYDDIMWEVIFMPANTEDDVSRLLSLELTNAWVNEARDIPKDVIDGLTGRVGRFPAKKDGGATHHGIIMDTNAMPHDHWWPIMAGEAPPPDWMSEEDRLTLLCPPEWKFYCQPPALLDVREKGTDQLIGYKMNPLAENVNNLIDGYYTQLIGGKRRDWINIYAKNMLGVEMSGKQIYDQFNEETHSPESRLEPHPEIPLIVGIDFGLTPAAVILQKVFGRWRALSEVVTNHMGAERFAIKLTEHLASNYPEWWAQKDTKIKFWGDPAGNQSSQTDETTPFQVLKRNDIPAKPAPTNDFELRVGAVDNCLRGMVDGLPRFTIDRYACPVLFTACKGGYQRKRLKTVEERYSDEPDKSNKYSHVAEALQYGLVGEGEARALVRDPNNKPKSGAATRPGNIVQRRRDQKRKSLRRYKPKGRLS